MNIKLIITGKTTEKYIKEGLDIYEGRLKHYVNFEVIELKNIKVNKAKNSANVQKLLESEAIMKIIKPADFIVLLDDKGKEFTSVEFAGSIQKSMNNLRSNLIYVIGGAYGFDEKIYKRSNLLLSLSKMTFSHQMVRLFFLEQLYRAMTIIRKESYHHE